MQHISSDVISTPEAMRESLRWVGIVSALVKNINVCASGGVHSHEAVIKQLLSGANTVQVCSVLYKNGITYISQLIDGLNEWMEKYSFESIAEFKGRLNYQNISEPAIYERTQFMKYFSEYE